ncbi:Glyceraldehyde-3-phosphate dehydrogenase [Trichinella pseudospiralis]
MTLSLFRAVVGRRICAILAVAEQDPISKASIKTSTLFPFYTVFSRVNRPDGRGRQFIGVINPAPVWAANCIIGDSPAALGSSRGQTAPTTKYLQSQVPNWALTTLLVGRLFFNEKANSKTDRF